MTTTSIQPKVKFWCHEGVSANGVLDQGGAVTTQAGIKVFRGTSCTCSTCNGDHDFVVICNGYIAEERKVAGKTFYFENTEDLDRWLEVQAFNWIQNHYLLN